MRRPMRGNVIGAMTLSAALAAFAAAPNLASAAPSWQRCASLRSFPGTLYGTGGCGLAEALMQQDGEALTNSGAGTFPVRYRGSTVQLSCTTDKDAIVCQRNGQQAVQFDFPGYKNTSTTKPKPSGTLTPGPICHAAAQGGELQLQVFGTMSCGLAQATVSSGAFTSFTGVNSGGKYAFSVRYQGREYTLDCQERGPGGNQILCYHGSDAALLYGTDA